MFPEKFNSLKLLSDCPVCHKKQFPADIKLLDDRDEGHLLHVRCKSCQSCLLVMVSLGEHGMNMVGVLTDLKSHEINKFLERGALTADDMIELDLGLRSGNFIEKLNVQT
jgi:hypothetical protein